MLQCVETRIASYCSFPGTWDTNLSFPPTPALTIHLFWIQVWSLSSPPGQGAVCLGGPDTPWLSGLPALLWKSKSNRAFLSFHTASHSWAVSTEGRQLADRGKQRQHGGMCLRATAEMMQKAIKEPNPVITNQCKRYCRRHLVDADAKVTNLEMLWSLDKLPLVLSFWWAALGA